MIKLLLLFISLSCAQSGRWTQLFPTISPSLRIFQTAVEFDDEVIIAGGQGLSDIWSFNNGIWTQLQPSVPILSTRYGFCSVPLNNFTNPLTASQSKGFFLFGGTNDSVNTFNEVYIQFLNTGYNTVMYSNSSESIASRWLHSCNLIGNIVYVLGGVGGSGDFSQYGEFWKYDLVTAEWENTTSISTEKPTLRWGHSVVTWSASSLILFGGRNSSSFFNDIWMFDTRTLSWSLLHSGSENAPSPRNLQSAVKLDEAFVIFGGMNNLSVFDDVWAFNITTRLWSLVSIETSKPNARFSHSAIGSGNFMFVFGGSANMSGSHFNDTWIFQYNGTTTDFTSDSSSFDLIQDKVIPGVVGAVLIIFFVAMALGLALLYKKQGER